MLNRSGRLINGKHRSTGEREELGDRVSVHEFHTEALEISGRGDRDVPSLLRARLTDRMWDVLGQACERLRVRFGKFVSPTETRADWI